MNSICNSMKSTVKLFSNYGTIRPCCVIDIDSTFDMWENSSIFKLNNLNQSLNVPVRNILKSEKSLGWIDECDYCKTIETSNFLSPREHSNNVLKGENFEELEIALDFYCNMTCRMCRPGVSSKWDNLIDEANELQKIEHEHYNNIGNHKAYIKRLKTVLENTDFTMLKELRIVGGEPFYSPNLLEFLLLLKSKLDLSSINFACNTNGSVIPNSKIIDLLYEFKSVKIDLSIDATGALAESIRPGVSWNTISENIKKWNSLFDIMLSPTISILNINTLQNIIDLNLPYHFMPLHKPFFLKHTQLDLNVRKKWLTSDEETNKLILMPFENINKKYFADAMRIMDRKMKSFSDANKEIWKLVN